MKPIILTGDRPTGPLHLGHFVGSLKSRVALQDDYDQFLLIADVQALTDGFRDPQKVRDNVLQIALDYLAVGLQPERNTIVVQSAVPALFELGSYFMNLLTVARLSRNPTVKEEIRLKNFASEIPVGFFCYPISQAADILGFAADLVPVGEDQNPMIELTNEIARRFNSLYSCSTFKEVQARVGAIGRLPGFDGQNKMSKSLGNAIFLSDSSEEIRRKVNLMYTDPAHLRVADPGQIEGNVVFLFLDFFDENKDELAELKAHYRRGGLGDSAVKKRLVEILESLVAPIRTRRLAFAQDETYVHGLLKAGTERGRANAERKLKEAKTAMGLYLLS